MDGQVVNGLGFLNYDPPCIFSLVNRAHYNLSFLQRFAHGWSNGDLISSAGEMNVSITAEFSIPVSKRGRCPGRITK